MSLRLITHPISYVNFLNVDDGKALVNKSATLSLDLILLHFNFMTLLKFVSEEKIW